MGQRHLSKLRIQPFMAKKITIFDEQYRVVAIEGDRLLIQGIRSGEVLAIVNPEPEIPLSLEDYPLGKLIALTDPSAAPLQDLNWDGFELRVIW